MAIINPKTLYSGGDVVLNSTPYTNFMINMLARKQAKEDAFNKYYGDLGSKLTPAGMHADDIPDFIQKKNDWQGYVMQNRKAIQNPSVDNGMAYREAMSKFNDAAGFAETSKDKVKNLLAAQPLLTNPNTRDRVTQKMLSDIQSAGLPLTDPNYKPLDLSSEDFNPKEYSAKDWQDYTKNFGMGVKPDKTVISTRPHPTDSLKQIEVTSSQYSPDKLKGFIDEAKNNYDNDSSLQYSFNKTHPFKDWTDTHISEFNRLNDLYKPLTGHDISDDSDLHAAMMVDRKMSPDITEKPVTNEGLKQQQQFRQQQIMEGIKQGNRESLLRLRPEVQRQNDAVNNLWLDSYEQQLKSEAENNNETRVLKYNGQEIHGKKVPLDPVVSQAIGFNEKNKGELVVSNDGKYYVLPYQTDASYNPIPSKDKSGYLVDKTRINEMNPEGLKLALGKKVAGVKQTNIEMYEGAKKTGGSYFIKGKKYSEKQLLDMGYNINQISPYKQK